MLTSKLQTVQFPESFNMAVPESRFDFLSKSKTSGWTEQEVADLANTYALLEKIAPNSIRHTAEIAKYRIPFNQYRDRLATFREALAKSVTELKNAVDSLLYIKFQEKSFKCFCHIREHLMHKKFAQPGKSTVYIAEHGEGGKPHMFTEEQINETLTMLKLQYSSAEEELPLVVKLVDDMDNIMQKFGGH